MNKTPYQPDPGNSNVVYINDDLSVPRHVVCAANRLGDTIICGARHWDKIMSDIADAIGGNGYADWEQGFIDQYGFFLTRKEAADIVVANNQNLRDYEIRGEKLFSENLY